VTVGEAEPRPTVVVVGAGIAGLTAAHSLTTPTDANSLPRVVVLEAEPRLGGKLASATLADQTIDLGPDGFLGRRPEAKELCDELGLGDALRPIGSQGASVWARGRRRPLPDGLVLGVPTRGWPLLRSRVLPAWRAIRVVLDVVFPRRDIRGPLGDRAIGPLVARKLGPAVVDTLVDPLVGGIHAGSVSDMSAAAVFPLLLVAKQGRRSFMRALRKASRASEAGASAPVGTFDAPKKRRWRRRSKPATASEPAFYALEGGMGALVARLEDALGERGVEIRSGTTVLGIEQRADGRWIVQTASDRLVADGIVLAVPAPAAATLVGPLDQEAATLLRGIDYASVALVTLIYDEAAFAEPLSGSGFLVPRTSSFPSDSGPEGPPLVTACTFLSVKWPHLKRPGEVMVRASVGRADDHRSEELDDDALVARVRDELAEFLGVATLPQVWLITRWPDSFPQYRVHHLLRVTGIEAAFRRLPGLVVAGASYRGVGIPACIASGRAAARALDEQLRAQNPDPAG
jgi:oxygen-dependent protoporphyrinogen oxidase